MVRPEHCFGWYARLWAAATDPQDSTRTVIPTTMLIENLRREPRALCWLKLWRLVYDGARDKTTSRLPEHFTLRDYAAKRRVNWLNGRHRLMNAIFARGVVPCCFDSIRTKRGALRGCGRVNGHRPAIGYQARPPPPEHRLLCSYHRGC
jgi:hypothetical protein